MITRSTGIPIEGTPYRAGGGYSGATPELDETVERAAEMLSSAFGRDVQIRFNSDHRSGGAFLADSLPGFNNSCEVGINASLRNWPDGMPCEEYIRREHELPDTLYISSYVAARVMHNPALANMGTTSRRYHYIDHPTIESALTWILDNVDITKLSQ